jgi:hypothetical protein
MARSQRRRNPLLLMKIIIMSSALKELFGKSKEEGSEEAK